VILPQDLAWRARRLLNRAGLDVTSYRSTRHPIARRLRLFANHGINHVLDIGANAGQYGKFLRTIGYAGQIDSYEPLASAFESLKATAAADSKWAVHRSAVGDKAGRLTLNVSRNSECSSVLPMLDRQIEAYPDAVYVGTEEVDVQTIDGIVEKLPSSASLFLKVDTQGYERNVLEGARGCLARIRGVQLELSLVPLYQGESLMPEMVNFLKELGFVLMALEPGSSDEKTGQLLQFDGLFFRPGS